MTANLISKSCYCWRNKSKQSFNPKMIKRYNNNKIMRKVHKIMRKSHKVMDNFHKRQSQFIHKLSKTKRTKQKKKQALIKALPFHQIQRVYRPTK